MISLAKLILQKLTRLTLTNHTSEVQQPSLFLKFFWQRPVKASYNNVRRKRGRTFRERMRKGKGNLLKDVRVILPVVGLVDRLEVRREVGAVFHALAGLKS